MPASNTVFTAVSSSARQLPMLLQCISFSRKATARITAEGLRFSTDDGSAMEAFVFLDKALFTTYTYKSPQTSTSGDDLPNPPLFEVSLHGLLEALKIVGLSDPSMSKRPGEYDSFAAHRLNRHAGTDAFSSRALGMGGICTFSYDGEGAPLSLHMSEGGVTTTCDLTTYEAETSEEIPFQREAIALKTILRSSYLLDATNELASVNPTSFHIQAKPSSSSHDTGIALSATGSIGSASVEWSPDIMSETPILETFQCPVGANATFRFDVLKAAQRAMATSSKVSFRLDQQGVLSLQFLIEVDPGQASSEAVAFVDFRAVPLVEDEEDANETDSSSTC